MTIDQIEQWFNENGIPTEKYQLDSGSIITDPIQFVRGHVAMLRGNPKKFRFLPYYNRIFKFYKYCYEKSSKERAVPS
jgi:hypothetical protein